MVFVHVQGGGVSPAAALLWRLRAALFPKAPSAQAAAVPTQVCLHGSLLAADLNENVSTNPSGFPTRTTTEKKEHVYPARNQQGRRCAELSRFCCETPSIGGVNARPFQ